MFCEFDNLYYLCGVSQVAKLVAIQTRRGNLLQVPEYRFESCPDYICITDWWSDHYGPNICGG